MGRNAMTDEDKQQRRSALLDAARRLFRDRGDLPPVSEIARAAGLAKGTVYLYFTSKEEIFVVLLEGAYGRLFDALAVTIAQLPGAPKEAAQQFSRAYAETILSQQEFLPLASLANSVLEQNLPVEAMRRFKTLLAMGLTTAGSKLEEIFPDLEPGQGATLLLQTYALTLGLWQALDYPEAARAMLNEPALKPLDRRFATELEAGVRAQWLGRLAVKD
jgi:AcrR family transcriptional regulator